MAQRRCILSLLTRHGSTFLSSNPSLKTLPHLRHFHNSAISTTPYCVMRNLNPVSRIHCCRVTSRCFGSKRNDTDEEDDDEEVGESTDGDEDDEDDDEIDNESVSNCAVKRVYSPEEKAVEAAEIGYKVIGPLQRSDRVFKEYEPAFAVVQIGSHQFKVSNGDCIYVERLKFCEVNDKLILNKVLLVGTSAQTVVGRPILPEAAVHAVVEEHALDAKVIIFKKKRRKNYRRTKGHRQELTKLRITSVEGIEIPPKTISEKPEKTTSVKSEKVAAKKSEKVPVAA